MGSRGIMRAFGSLAVVVACAPLGCAAMADIQAGYVTAPSGREGRSGVALHARAVGGEASLVQGFALRAKVSGRLVQVAPAYEALVLAAERDSAFVPYAGVGVHVLQFESVDRRFAFGMFSPYAQIGAAIPLPFNVDALGRTVRGPLALLIAGTAEYAVRFSSAPNEIYVTATIGVGYFFQAF